MADIVLGLGFSHSPMASMEPHWWPVHGQLDRHHPEFDYEEEVSRAPSRIGDELSPRRLGEKHRACQEAIARLSITVRDVAPDVIVVVGDDQNEMFREHKPMFAVYAGETVDDLPGDTSGLPPSVQAAAWSIHGDERESYPVDAALAEHIVASVVADGFDVASCTGQVAGRSIGHAYTWVRRRLYDGCPMVPVVPIFLNTYYPPNQPTAARCVAFGSALHDAITSWPTSARVAIAASGGLSHFLIDEELDQHVLGLLANNDLHDLGRIDRTRLQSGSSEILNWICAAGILAPTPLRMEVVDYIAAYRTEAGSGVGLAFALWQARPVAVDGAWREETR